MPIKREDVIKVDELKATIDAAFRRFSDDLRGVFGELVYSVDTVIEKHNDLEAKLDAVSARVLALERRLTEH